MENRQASKRFLSSIYDLVREGNDKEAMSLLYAHFYKLRMDGNSDLCQQIISDIDEKALTPTLLVAVLTVTAPRRSAAREALFKRAKRAISQIRGDETASRMLIGLE